MKPQTSKQTIMHLLVVVMVVYERHRGCSHKGFKKCVYLCSQLPQQNYPVWAACPQNPRKRCVCPPGGMKGSLGLLLGAVV